MPARHLSRRRRHDYGCGLTASDSVSLRMCKILLLGMAAIYEVRKEALLELSILRYIFYGFSPERPLDCSTNQKLTIDSFGPKCKINFRFEGKYLQQLVTLLRYVSGMMVKSFINGGLFSDFQAQLHSKIALRCQVKIFFSEDCIS